MNTHLFIIAEDAIRVIVHPANARTAASAIESGQKVLLASWQELQAWATARGKQVRLAPADLAAETASWPILRQTLARFFAIPA